MALRRGCTTMRLKNQILLGYLAIAALLLGIGGFGLHAMNAIEQEFSAAMTRTQPVLEALHEIRIQANRLTLRVVGADEQRPTDAEILDPYPLQRSMEDYFDLVRKMFPEERELAGRIKLRANALIGDLSALSELPAGAGRDTRDALISDSRKHLAEIEAQVARALDGERSELRAYRSASLAFAEHYGKLMLLFGGLAMSVALAGGWWLSRRVTRPVDDLRAAAARLGKGEFGTRVRDRGHDEIGDLGAAFDRMAEELAETVVSRDDLETIIESISDGLMVISPDGVVERANTAMRLMCRTAHEGPLAGRRANEILQCEGRRTLLDGPFVQEGFQCRIHGDPDPQRTVAVISTLIQSRGRKRGRVLLVRDRRARDASGGVGRARQLPDARAASDHLATRLSVLEWRGRNVGVLLVGLDRAREMERSLGSQVCEGLVGQIAERIRSVLRPDDAVAVWSDEALAVVLEDLATPDDLAPIGDALLEALDKPVRFGQHEFRLTASIGMSCAPLHGTRADLLLACAETAMRCVRADGTRRCMMYAHPSGRGSTDRLPRH